MPKAPALTPRLRAKMAHCGGCRNDFYNQGNGLHGFCWSLPSARLVTRFRTHRDTMPASPGAFEQVKVFQCYHAPPLYFQTSVPAFVHPKEVIGSRAWKQARAREERFALKMMQRSIRRAAAPPGVDVDPDDIPF